MKALIEKTRRYLSRRRDAYIHAFVRNQFGHVVLEDLAKFCRAYESTYHANSRLSDVLLGRHEVWLRIQQHLRLSDEELWQLYGNSKSNLEE